MLKTSILYMLALLSFNAFSAELSGGYIDSSEEGSSPVYHGAPAEMSAAFHEDGAAGGEHEDLNLLNKLRAQNQYLLNIVGRQGEMIELLKSRIKTLEDER